MKEPDEERFRAYRHASLYLTIPLLLAVSPFVGYFLGRILDRFFHTGETLSLVFLALGFIAGGRETYRLLARVSREDRAAREARDRRNRDRTDRSNGS
jgi:ATP synthase protein I